MASKFLILLLFLTLVVGRRRKQASRSNTETPNDLPPQIFNDDPHYNICDEEMCDDSDEDCRDTMYSLLITDCCLKTTATTHPLCTTAITTTSIYYTSNIVCPSLSSTLSIVTTTVTVAASPTTRLYPPSLSTASNMQTNIGDMDGQSPSKTAVSSNSMTTAVIGLGALLGLSLVLLAVVITGWVCTCLIARKRNRIIGVRTYGTEPEEKYFENPTYDDSSMIMLHGTPGPGAYKVPVLPVAVARRPLTQKASEGATRMYDAVNTTSPKDARKGQTYDVLDRGKVNGKRSTARNVRAPKGYGQLGLPDKDVDNNYHLVTNEND